MLAPRRVPTDSPSRQNPSSFGRTFLRNFFQLLGFETASDLSQRHGRAMVRSSHSRSGIFPSLPRDYMRRRRALRRISNIVLVLLLSAALAYVIVHVSGPGAFSAPHH